MSGSRFLPQYRLRHLLAAMLVCAILAAAFNPILVPLLLLLKSGFESNHSGQASLEEELKAVKQLRKGAPNEPDVFIGWPVDEEDIQKRRMKYEAFVDEHGSP